MFENLGRKILITLLMVFLSVAGYILIDFKNIKTTEAGVADNVLGWGWLGANWTNAGATNPVGWVSFNDINSGITCGSISYGVNVGSLAGNERSISGAAWVGIGENNVYIDCDTTENTVGWIYFDAEIDPNVPDTPSCGNQGFPSNYCFPAKVVGSEIQGWAPIVSKDQRGVSTILTWVRFKGNSYSNFISNVSNSRGGSIGTNPLDATTNHYAWSGHYQEGGLGWLDLSRVVFPLGITPSVPPSVDANPANRESNCIVITAARETRCSSSAVPPIRLSWTFNDPGDYQTAYRLQIDRNENFNTPDIDTGKVDSSSGFYAPQNLSWNANYYWRVKVWDSQELESDWDGGSFLTDNHQWPAVNFSWLPVFPAVNQNTSFEDSSSCYNPAGNTVPCETWFWTFPNAQPPTSSVINPQGVKFLSGGEKNVTLLVRDSDGYECPCTKSVMRGPLPIWREIPPFWRFILPF